MTTNSAWTSFSATFVDAENVPNFYLAAPCFRMHKASCHTSWIRRQSSAALAHSIGFVYNISARPWINHHFHNTSTHNHLHYFRLCHWLYSSSSSWSSPCMYLTFIFSFSFFLFLGLPVLVLHCEAKWSAPAHVLQVFPFTNTAVDGYNHALFWDLSVSCWCLVKIIFMYTSTISPSEFNVSINCCCFPTVLWWI